MADYILPAACNGAQALAVLSTLLRGESGGGEELRGALEEWADETLDNALRMHDFEWQQDLDGAIREVTDFLARAMPSRFSLSYLIGRKGQWGEEVRWLLRAARLAAEHRPRLEAAKQWAPVKAKLVQLRRLAPTDFDETFRSAFKRHLAIFLASDFGEAVSTSGWTHVTSLPRMYGPRVLLGLFGAAKDTGLDLKINDFTGHDLIINDSLSVEQWIASKAQPRRLFYESAPEACILASHCSLRSGQRSMQDNYHDADNKGVAIDARDASTKIGAFATLAWQPSYCLALDAHPRVDIRAAILHEDAEWARCIEDALGSVVGFATEMDAAPRGVLARLLQGPAKIHAAAIEHVPGVARVWTAIPTEVVRGLLPALQACRWADPAGFDAKLSVEFARLVAPVKAAMQSDGSLDLIQLAPHVPYLLRTDGLVNVAVVAENVGLDLAEHVKDMVGFVPGAKIAPWLQRLMAPVRSKYRQRPSIFLLAQACKEAASKNLGRQAY